MLLFRTTSRCIPLFAYLTSNAVATFLTLSQFQQISGFTDTCSAAYNTPLTHCAQSDFENGRSCSNKCVEQLAQISTRLNTACKGTKAYPNTLIGMFFENGGVGVAALCPNVQGSTGSVGGYGGNTGGNSGSNGGGVDSGQSSQTTAAASISRSTPKAPASSTESQISKTQQSTQTQPAAASTSLSPVKPTISTTPPVAHPTIDSAATLTQSGLAGLKSTTVRASSSSTSTSPGASASASAQADRNNNGNSGGSGGTPFDISSSARTSATTPSMLAFTMGFAALLYVG